MSADRIDLAQHIDTDSRQREITSDVKYEPETAHLSGLAWSPYFLEGSIK